MAESARIEVTIAPDGTVTLKTHGLKGQACIEETKSLETAVGRVVQREKTSEFYVQGTAAQTKTRNR